jgi:hypothetical protein
VTKPPIVVRAEAPKGVRYLKRKPQPVRASIIVTAALMKKEVGGGESVDYRECTVKRFIASFRYFAMLS